MNGDIVGDMVNHLDDDAIALPRHDLRAGKLAVDGHDAPRAAEPRHVLQPYLQEEIEEKPSAHRF